MPKVNLNRLIDAWDPILQKAFLESISNITDQAQIEQIAKAIADGSLQATMKAAGVDPVLFRPLDKALQSAFEAGGNITTSGFPAVGNPGEFKTVFQFDVRNPAAEAWLKDYSSSLVTEIVDDQRAMIQQVMERGLAAGNNPRTIALDLVGRVGVDGKRSGGLIGLTSSQAEWVQNYADTLASNSPADAMSYNLRDARFDAALQRAEDSGIPLTQEQIDTMTDSYTNRALRYRAEGIARTEAMAALHESQKQAIQQAIDSGELPQENVSMIWRTTHDKRTRESHRVMDGQVRKHGEMFLTGDGNELEFPGDPNGPAEEVINCFPAGTKVYAEGIVRAYRRWYEGKLFEITTANGIKLSATPNHPILSSRGLIGISLLNEGDDVICNDFTKRVSFVDPNVKNIPTCIEKKFDALAVYNAVVRSVSLPVDFHGDGSYSNVDIVSSTRVLMDRREATDFEPIDNFKLSNPKEVAGVDTAVCTQAELSIGSFSASDGSVRSRNLSKSSLFAKSGVLEEFGFGSSSDMDAIFFEDCSDHEASDIKLLCQRLNRMSGKIELANLRSNLGTDSSFHSTRAKAFCTDKIVKISHVDFSGYVYNFETETGLFMAENVVVGNCRCWLEPSIDFYAGLE